MSLTAVLGFAGVAFALIVVPGPDWAYILAVGARDHVVWPAAAGLMAGYLLIAAVVVAGVGPFVTTVPTAMTTLTVVGAAYLAFLGIRTLRRTAHVAEAALEASTASRARGYVARGMVVSGLNPKGLLIFVAILPQFATASAAWPLPLQLAVLGAVYVVITGAFYVPLGYAAERVLGVRPGVAQATTRIAGVAMIVIGLSLVVEQLPLPL